VGVIIACITGLLLFRRKKIRRREKAQNHIATYESLYELNGSENKDPLLKVGGDIVELSRNERPAELEHPPVELEAREVFVDNSGSGTDRVI
jgi:hypothetical protein